MALTDNLSSYYKMEGNSNDAAGSNNGTDTAITYSTANGKITQGAGFNGSTSKITATATAITGACSFGGWFYTNSIGTTTKGLIQNYQQNSNPSGWRLFFDSSSKAHVVVGKNTGLTAGTDYQEVAGSTTISTGQWYFIVGVYSPSSYLKVYVNNSEDGTSSSVPSAITNPNVFRMGCTNASGTDGEFLNGKMDETFYYSKALSTTELTELYNGGAGLQYPFSRGAAWFMFM